MHRLCAIAAFAAVLVTATAAQAATKAAIFPFELIDVSLEGEYNGTRPDETQRLALITTELRDLAARDAGLEVVDLGAVAADIEHAAPFYKCDACEVDIARKVGAEVAITGAVRKISNLVLVIQLYVRDVGTGKVNAVHRVELRGNTDESWLRGVQRLAKTQLANGGAK